MHYLTIGLYAAVSAGSGTVAAALLLWTVLGVPGLQAEIFFPASLAGAAAFSFAGWRVYLHRTAFHTNTEEQPA